MDTCWYQVDEHTHELHRADVVVARVSEVATDGPGGRADFVIMVDPAAGIQRVNEAMKLRGSAYGGSTMAKHRVAALLERFGFGLLVPNSVDSKPIAKKPKPKKRRTTKRKA